MDEQHSGGPISLGGRFLISEINLTDPNFYRSVILMISHDESGAFGLVLNRRSRFTLGELLEETEGSPAAALPVFVGGPVQQEALFVLHTDASRFSEGDDSKSPLPGVVFEPMARATLDYLAKEWATRPEDDRPKVRIYAGYSGWGPGQVEGELKAEAWVVIEGSQEMVFHPDPSKGWAEALASKGPLYQIYLQTGFKPSMN